MQETEATTAASLPRPAFVTIACALLVASFAIAIVRFSLVGGWESPFIKLAWLAGMVVVGALAIVPIYRRKNWVRLIVLAWILLGLIGLPWSHDSNTDPLQYILNLVQAAIQAGVAVLLLLPPSHKWFRSHATPVA